MVSLSNWMMGRCCYTRPKKHVSSKTNVDVYGSPLGFCWKPYATEREKERRRTRSRKASSITVVITDLSPPSRRVIIVGSFCSSYPYADKLLQSIEQTPVGFRRGPLTKNRCVCDVDFVIVRFFGFDIWGFGLSLKVMASPRLLMLFIFSLG
ncbi:hypothetical protein Hanom_Chr10g00958471 [Helianthus anomalus]